MRFSKYYLDYLVIFYYKYLILIIITSNQLLKMGRKNSANISEPIEEEDELTMEQQVEQAIKKLPTLEEKVQVIALNHYLIEKRELDKKLEGEVNKI